MSWLELDDRILDHPKFIRVAKLGGSESIHLWLGIRAYCGQLLTDGFVPEDMIGEVRGPRDGKRRSAALDALVEVGLIDRVDGGLMMHDYLDWSSSKDEITGRRRSARDRQRRHRGPDVDVTRDSLRDDDVTSPLVTDPRARDPLPLRSTPLQATPDVSSFWTGYQWRERFGRSWCEKYQRIAYGGGDADSKATGDLADQLGRLPDAERTAAQKRAPQMFAEFLADEDPRTVKARHPWSWFVNRFPGLLVPAMPVRAAASRASGPTQVDTRR